jgi:iron(III) transport system permease protein
MKIRRPRGMTVLTALAVVAVGYLLIVPLAIQLVTSIRGTYLPFGLPNVTWGLQNYHTLYTQSGDFGDTILQTAIFVGVASVLAFVVGGALAWLVTRTDLPGRNVVAVLAIVPFVLPPIVRAQAYQLMLAPESGVLNQILRVAPWWSGKSGPIDPFAFSSIVVIEAMSAIPFTFWLLMPILQNMDGALEEAARTAGASWWQTVRRVTLPVLWPPALGVYMLSLMLMLGDLEVPLLFGQQSGNNIFALRLWNLITPPVGSLPQYGVAAAYGMNFLVFMSILFWFYLRVTRRASAAATVGGKAFRPNRLRLGRAKAPATLVVVCYLVPTALLPLLALLWSAVTPYPMALTWSNVGKYTDFAAFRAVFGDSEFWQSAERTVIIAGLSATLAAVVATVLAYTAVRTRGRFTRQVLDTIGMSSIAIPATIAGFSAFLLYLVANKYVALSGTIWALVLTYAYRMSVSYRTSYGAVLQINPELEEAGGVNGGSRLAVFRRVTLPLIMPTVLSVWIQMFILGANEFTLAAFLSTPQTQPLSIYIYSSIDPKASTYHPAQGAAAALIFSLLVLLVGYGARAVLARRGRGHRRSRQPRTPPPVAAPAAQPAAALAAN